MELHDSYQKCTGQRSTSQGDPHGATAPKGDRGIYGIAVALALSVVRVADDDGVVLEVGRDSAHRIVKELCQTCSLVPVAVVISRNNLQTRNSISYNSESE
jgi:hypothetical protein